MNKFISIILSILRNDEHFQFHSEIRDLILKIGAMDLNIEMDFDEYVVLYMQVDEALKKINKSAITADIQTADKRRDMLFRGMSDANKSALNHFSEDVRQAATRIQIVLDTYGNLAQKPLNEQTSGVYNILQDLNGSKYKPDAIKVKIIDWMNELHVANEAFRQLMKDRFDETTMKTDIVFREARLKLDAKYRLITERIEALALIEKAKVHTDFIRSVNTIIDKYTTIVAQRTGKKKAKKN